MFSGTCKKETGVEHARLIQTLLTAAENQRHRNAAFYRTICIASDGEAKRGDALVRLTMNRDLHRDSPIYEHVGQLRFMNLLVGCNDITADKDFKHVFKRQRNLMMRNKGIFIQGFCITPSILRNHLQSNGVSTARLRSLLNPNDRQDVVLGYSLLKEIWSLPPTSDTTDSTPSFLRARKALHVYGQFARNLIMPYICVDFNLDEQLIHLSTAAHLALYMFSDDSARTKFMPTQSYIDIMIMIKNVYFCVAKTKVDNPSGNFFIIQLGTDRLETFFGLVRTAVGPDNNVDMIQLGSRASGLTEVAVILARHPEWDRSPRRLQLPVIARDSGVITSKADHINPGSWHGNVNVSAINLQTCWILGRQKAVELVPEAGNALDLLESTPGVDILSPFGDLMVGIHDADDLADHPADDDYDCSEIAGMYEDPQTNNALDVPARENISMPFTHEGDMEDAIADDAPQNTKISSEIMIEGGKTTKAKALRHRMMYQTNRSSTDRLKRVQEIPCFNSIPSSDHNPDIISHDSSLGLPCLRIGNPIAGLVRCEEHIFLAISQVNRLHFASNSDLDHIQLHYLVDSSSKVDFQILRLLPATSNDDPSQEFDWCWSLKMEATVMNVPGRLIHPINPTMSVHMPGQPTYLFESSFLLSLSSSLYQELQPQDLRELPTVKCSEYFPYRSEGKACFVCEQDEPDGHINNENADCLLCGPKVHLNRSSGQRVLEHMGAHLLFDNSIGRSTERCGLCLRPSPMCRLIVKKGRGANSSPRIDVDSSTCVNLVRFNYATAARSSEGSPCSNVPINCPLCPEKSPAVWTYNLNMHFRERHKLRSQALFPIKAQLSKSEEHGMRQIWEQRFSTRKPRRRTKKAALVLSEAHSSRLALRCSLASIIIIVLGIILTNM